MYKEYKVVKCTHNYSNIDREGKLAYAIVATTHLVAEPDIKPTVCLDKENDMFVIAKSFDIAYQMLNEYISVTFGRK